MEKEKLIKKELPGMTPGDTIRVSEKLLEESKKKSQVFEGILISQKHGKGINATFTLRSIVGGVGVEKTYPLCSPLIEKIEITKKGKSRRAKLYYLRDKAQKEIRKKLKSQRVVKEKDTVEKKKVEPQKEENKEKKPEKVKEVKAEPNKEEKKKE